MITKEEPEFFDCRCDEPHYVIEITDAMRNRARSLQGKTNEVDKTDARSQGRSQEDSFVGKLAEVAVQEFFKENGVSASFNDGWMYDMDIGGNTAEIKARDYTQTAARFCDLLVRDREDTSWSPSDVDIIVQVMVDGRNSDKAYITGFAYGNYAAECGFFDKAKTHRTREVWHSKLKSVDRLL